MTMRVLERATPWANRAKLYIGLLKETVRNDMCAKNLPMVLWDYAIERAVAVSNTTAKDNFKL